MLFFNSLLSLNFLMDKIRNEKYGQTKLTEVKGIVVHYIPAITIYINESTLSQESFYSILGTLLVMVRNSKH